jgi:predicted unusual protein kinase regulating ubiquinone biosynthesis (AarF/ABC1/UbiB family)
MRTADGKLAILDFGLMTEITDDQKYGMIEAIAHLLNRDYTEIGQDFVNLEFIPKGTDTRPIIPALTKVFDVALAGGGAKSINFQELAADLAQITYQFPFRIPPYFALVIRAISVLEGIALVGNPQFAIVDEGMRPVDNWQENVDRHSISHLVPSLGFSVSLYCPAIDDGSLPSSTCHLTVHGVWTRRRV